MNDIKEEIFRTWYWQENPLAWVTDIFGDEIKKRARLKSRGRIKTKTGLSRQQEGAFLELGKLIRAKLNFARGKKLSSKEKYYLNKIGISIQSGTGTGKDTFASLVLLYFLHVFPNPKVLATANSQKQLRNVLWSEISKVMSWSRRIDPNDSNSPRILEFLFKWNSEKIYHRGKGGKRWFAEAVTAPISADENAQVEVLGGRHEDYQLFIIDEASGIRDAVFRPIEGTLTGIVNIVLMIFNPTRSTGFAINSQTRDKQRWICLNWNSEKSELVSKAFWQGLARYGKDSNTYRIRVLGLPPLSDSDALIPWEWIEDAKKRTITPRKNDRIIKGWDFGAGRDKSIIITRKGGKIYPIKRKVTRSSNNLLNWIYSDFLSDEADVGYGDSIGIGWSIMGNLRKMLGGMKAKSVDGRSRAYNHERFFNKRAENFWNLREAFEKEEIDIPDDDELVNQLGALQFSEEGGKIKITKKGEIKKGINSNSPDEVDALVNTYSDNSKAIRNSFFGIAVEKHIGNKKRGELGRIRDDKFIPDKRGIIEIWNTPNENGFWSERYCIGTTAGDGYGYNYSVAYVYDRAMKKFVARMRTDTVDPEKWSDLLIVLAEYYYNFYKNAEITQSLIIPARFGSGITVCKYLYKKDANVYTNTDSTKVKIYSNIIGWLQTKQSTIDIMNDLKHFMLISEDGIYDELLLDEAETFMQEGDELKAVPGFYEDCVWAAALAIHGDYYIDDSSVDITEIVKNKKKEKHRVKTLDMLSLSAALHVEKTWEKILIENEGDIY